ncbi:hypothetical protein WG66_016848 [Moniliophthora roreri]|nr:hypothetical protein WG66_016848 [Moniliophthora roreri]
MCEEQQINKDLEVTQQLAELGIGILGNPKSTRHTIITCHHWKTVIQNLNSLLGLGLTIGAETPTKGETLSSLTPESTDGESPMRTNSEISEEKTGNSPIRLRDSSSSNDSKEATRMAKGGSSTLKQELKLCLQEQMMITVVTAVLEEMEKKKKEKRSKVAAPDSFEGDRKDTKRFLMEVEIDLHMHPTDYDNDEKNKDPELMWNNLKDAFKKHYLPADIQAEAQLKIEELRMTDQADNYINNFRVMADESEYDDQPLIHIFRKGLPLSLAGKILNQPQERPDDLEGWYKVAI